MLRTLGNSLDVLFSYINLIDNLHFVNEVQGLKTEETIRNELFVTKFLIGQLLSILSVF